MTYGSLNPLSSLGSRSLPSTSTTVSTLPHCWTFTLRLSVALATLDRLIVSAPAAGPDDRAEIRRKYCQNVEQNCISGSGNHDSWVLVSKGVPRSLSSTCMIHETKKMYSSLPSRRIISLISRFEQETEKRSDSIVSRQKARVPWAPSNPRKNVLLRTR